MTEYNNVTVWQPIPERPQQSLLEIYGLYAHIISGEDQTSPYLRMEMKNKNIKVNITELWKEARGVIPPAESHPVSSIQKIVF